MKTACGKRKGPCRHCGTEETPLWRAGPPDKPTLCNACGTRWKTKGYLDAGYMPGQRLKQQKAKEAGSSGDDGHPTDQDRPTDDTTEMIAMDSSFASRGVGKKAGGYLQAVKTQEEALQITGGVSGKRARRQPAWMQQATSMAPHGLAPEDVHDEKRQRYGGDNLFGYGDHPSALSWDLPPTNHPPEPQHANGSVWDDLQASAFEQLPPLGSLSPLLVTGLNSGGNNTPSLGLGLGLTGAAGIGAQAAASGHVPAHAPLAHGALGGTPHVAAPAPTPGAQIATVAAHAHAQGSMPPSAAARPTNKVLDRKPYTQHALTSQHSPLADIDLADIINHETFLCCLSMEEQQSLLAKFGSLADPASTLHPSLQAPQREDLNRRLRGLFESQAFRKQLKDFQELLKRGLFDTTSDANPAATVQHFLRLLEEPKPHENGWDNARGSRSGSQPAEHKLSDEERKMIEGLRQVEARAMEEMHRSQQQEMQGPKLAQTPVVAPEGSLAALIGSAVPVTPPGPGLESLAPGDLSLPGTGAPHVGVLVGGQHAAQHQSALGAYHGTMQHPQQHLHGHVAHMHVPSHHYPGGQASAYVTHGGVSGYGTYSGYGGSQYSSVYGAPTATHSHAPMQSGGVCGTQGALAVAQGPQVVYGSAHGAVDPMTRAGPMGLYGASVDMSAHNRAHVGQ
ncbi:unnamed protein product [Pedinophyceae sp. YPF-701]|nr:unnamed protein product [Pedinophyceae sp. YPF-701]